MPSAAASPVFAAPVGHHPPPTPCPIAVSCLMLMRPPTRSPRFAVTLLDTFLPLLSVSPPPPRERHPLPIFPVVTVFPCPLSYHHNPVVPYSLAGRQLFLSIVTFLFSHPLLP